jgi:RNA polymerase sigma-70 factor (ECF subfamily)
MERYQQADPDAPAALVGALSPALLRFFKSQVASREQADDLLQETWLRIHRVRHTYRPGQPVLALDICHRKAGARGRLPPHATHHACRPTRSATGSGYDVEGGGLTLEEVVCATSSTVGAVKQKAHRAYARLRKLLQIQAGERAKGVLNELP